MNWIKQNTFLSGLIAVALVGVIGLGYLLFKVKGQHTKALAEYREAAEAKENLERKKPYPNEGNHQKLVQAVNAYKSMADDLRRDMLRLQVPLPEGVTPSKFQESLGARVDEVQNRAEAASVKLPDGFYLGMNAYEAALPSEGAAARLQFQLDATAWLAHLIIDNEAGTFRIDRKRMPFETAEPKEPNNPRDQRRTKSTNKKGPAPVSEVYPMEVAFSAKPLGFQRILNALGNTRASLGQEGGVGQEYYFVTRYLRVENARPAGPERSDPEELAGGGAAGGSGAEGSGAEGGAAEGGGAEGGGAEANAEAEEGGGSFNIIFGAEEVRAYLALDLVRLISPGADEEDG